MTPRLSNVLKEGERCAELGSREQSQLLASYGQRGDSDGGGSRKGAL